VTGEHWWAVQVEDQVTHDGARTRADDRQVVSAQTKRGTPTKGKASVMAATTGSAAISG